MAEPLVVFFYGLVTSLIFALYSVGFSLVFGVARVIDAAYGIWYTTAAYLVYALVTRLLLPLPVTVVVVVASMVALGISYYAVLVRGLQEKVEMIMTTFLVALMAQYLIVAIFTNFPWSIPALFPGSTQVLGVSLFNQQVAAAITAFLLLLVLWYLVYRTKMGLAIRAVAQDKEAALLMGINPDRVMAFTLALSCSLAGIAALLQAPNSVISPTMGWPMLTLAFAVVVLGGMGDFFGAIIASFIIGFSYQLITNLVNPLYSMAAALAMILLVLWLRPRGLFGRSLE
ncbi:MAG: branched-chain amino acid ABC transporter permease [Nitrososphaerota archaeon]|nr:branched-chain amino acid ABC transporter permease [Candidatus Calditenuis fumarioli]